MIRQAVSADIPQLLEFGAQFHAESRYADYGVAFDPVVLEAGMRTFTEGRTDGAMFVADRSNELIGGCAVVRVPTFMSAASIAIEIFLWLKPSHRGAMDGVRMILAIERWALENGCAAVSLIDIDAMRTNSTAAQVFRKLGYSRGENSWIKKV